MKLLIVITTLLLRTISARDIIKLEAVNFELAITSYPYVAILFHDLSEKSKVIERNWDEVVQLLVDVKMDGELAKMDIADPEMKEIVDAYRLTGPSIKVFRRGTMVDYRGPYDTAQAIADYIRQDCLPSIQFLKSFVELKKAVRNLSNAMVIGFFGSADVTEDVADMYSMDAWGQFQSAADALRGHVPFFVVTSESVMEEFNVDASSVPAVFLIPENQNRDDGEEGGLLKYTGELLEIRLVDWVLRNSPPSVGELSFTNSAGELYATQFFSSKMLKFILFLPPGESSALSEPIAAWKAIAAGYKKKAAFSYIIGDTVPDVLEYFGVVLQSHVPIIVAHNPNRDYKYKSPARIQLTTSSMKSFVHGVLSGEVQHILRSEQPSKLAKGSYVVKAVGSNVLSIVSDATKDVLLEVYTSSCSRCKALAPTYDILGKAFQGEDRVVIAKIDASANDLPLSWGVKKYPTILWFPKSDKPYSTSPTPQPYWDAGVSLHELVTFVVRQSSFDSKSLKVATSEQLGSLLSDEDALRAKYDQEERWARRNEGRTVLDNAVYDFMFGEVVFDGLRWHFALVGILALAVLGLSGYVLYSCSSSNKDKSKKKKSS